MMQIIPDPRRQAFLSYIRLVGDMYGLKDWTFELDNERPRDEQADASIYCVPGRKFGYIRLAQTFLDSEPVCQRLCIVHELTHCHDAMAYGFAQDHLSEEMKPIHRSLTEYMIDGISTSIAHMFPLPGKQNEPSNKTRKRKTTLGERNGSPR